MKTVWVHAWEYVNPGPDAGGGGFDWYPRALDAAAAYALGAAHDTEGNPEDFADFLFAVQVESEDADAITREIDAALIDHCADATERRVGANVAAYWKASGFNMGPV